MYKLRLAASAAWGRALAALRSRQWEILAPSSEEAGEEEHLLLLEASEQFPTWPGLLDEAVERGVPVLAAFPADHPQAALGSGSLPARRHDFDMEWFPVAQWDAETLAHLSQRLCCRASSLRRRQQLKEQRLQQKARESLMQKLVHDMKSPLTVMLMDLGMLERWWEKGNSDRFQVGVGRLTQNCEELIGMIQNLLDANRLRERELRVSLVTLGVGAVLREVLENPPSSLEKKNIQLQLDLRHTETSLEMDPSIMGRVLENLLKVAARVTPKGGGVEVSARRVEEQMEIKVGVKEASFDADKALVLLQPYAHDKWRALGVDAGNGIGFNFCRMAVERHGGTLSVESARSGVDFVVRLPNSPKQL
ncbi:MAG TPA: HAMP domain-containing sensor histidine kinase [Acidobacteriota bacterium]|nr:HAMP domain-containing sensor histidine kinase [Acidobacteriota bacterium]